MSENLKTIRELADELGVSKTAINKKVSDSERKQWFLKNGNRFLVNENGQKAIRIMFSSGIDNHKSKTENTYQQPESKTENFENANLKHSDINYLNDIIKYQNAQIEDLKENINKPILIYCKVGNKSALACQMLEEEGFVNLYNLGQGILGYEGKLV